MLSCTTCVQADWCISDVPPQQHIEGGATLAPFESRWVQQAVAKGSSGAAGSSAAPSGGGATADPSSGEEC